MRTSSTTPVSAAPTCSVGTTISTFRDCAAVHAASGDSSLCGLAQQGVSRPTAARAPLQQRGIDLERRGGDPVRREHVFGELPRTRRKRTIATASSASAVAIARAISIESPGCTTQPVRRSSGMRGGDHHVFGNRPDRRGDDRPRHGLRFGDDLAIDRRRDARHHDDVGRRIGRRHVGDMADHAEQRVDVFGSAPAS